VPYITRPRQLVRRAAILSSTVFAVATAAPALAVAAGCPTLPTTKPFASFGDTAAYELLSGGAFESGTTGWSLNGSVVANGNESYKVHGSADAKSLTIKATGTAISPSFCVDITRPTFRFFLRRTSGTWGVMNVAVRWTDANGGSHDTTVGSLNGGGSWSPSPVLALASSLPLWQAGSTINARIVFNPEDYGGAWAIDDVYVDPYSR